MRWAFLKLGRRLDFSPLGEGEASAPASIDFNLTLRLCQTSALAALVGPVFDKIAGSLVDAFVKRAEQVYGEA